jgi:hypothetical protein
MSAPLWRQQMSQIQCVPLATEPGISLMSCQQQFLEKSGGRHPPSKSSIWALSRELETKGLYWTSIQEVVQKWMSVSVASGIPFTADVTFRQPVLWGSSVAHIALYDSVWLRLTRSQCAPNRNEIEKYPLLSYNCKMTVVEVQTQSFFRNITRMNFRRLTELNCCVP